MQKSSCMGNTLVRPSAWYSSVIGSRMYMYRRKLLASPRVQSSKGTSVCLSSSDRSELSSRLQKTSDFSDRICLHAKLIGA